MDRPKDLQEILDRMSKDFRPNITKSFQLNQIEFLRKLGQGMSSKVFISIFSFSSFIFIQVYLIKYQEKYFALKTLEKHSVLEGQSLSYVQSEREILSQCQSNPFIVQLYSTFQTAERLFFLMEVARAGCLYDLLEYQAPRPIRQERIIFYTGQVTSALIFLHSKRIVKILLCFDSKRSFCVFEVYRDLKPENVFVFEDGNVKLGDFGLSKQNIDRDHQTNTVCGTPEYMAYEIYNHESYDQNVDWWSLGILIFELSTFKTPFYANNTTMITENVLQGNVDYPTTMNEETKQIVSALLERDPKRRLGNHKSPHGSIYNQPFFR